MKLLQKNKNLVILSAVTIILFLIVVLYSLSEFSLFNRPTPVPPNLNEATISGWPGMSADDITDEDKENSEKSSTVYQMVQDLPYNGGNFALYYYYSDDSFKLYINPNNIATGQQELKEFLNQRGIADVSWLHNVTRVSSKPTPEP